MEDGLLDVGSKYIKASSLRRQMQQRIDEITEHLESVGGKDES
jgi:hypothetical protein